MRRYTAGCKGSSTKDAKIESGIKVIYLLGISLQKLLGSVTITALAYITITMMISRQPKSLACKLITVI